MKRRIDFTELPRTKARIFSDLLIGVDTGLHIVDHMVLHSAGFVAIDNRVKEHVLAAKAVAQAPCPIQFDVLADVSTAILHVRRCPSHLEVVAIDH